MNTNDEIRKMKEAIAKQEETTNKIYRYSLSSIIVISMLALFFLKPSQAIVNENTAIIIQSIAILAMMIVIPLSLKLYKMKLDSIPTISNREQLQKIKNLYTTKLAANMGVALFCISAYILTKDTSMLYCCVISFLILIFFCKPDNIETKETDNNNQR